MPKFKPTPELIEGILARIPEGFIQRHKLEGRLGSRKKTAPVVETTLLRGVIAGDARYVFDPARTSIEQVYELAQWCYPSLPRLEDGGGLPDATILERRKAHLEILQHFGDPAYERFMEALPQGYASVQELSQSAQDEAILKGLLGAGLLRRKEDTLYDPLRFSASTIDEMNRRRSISSAQQMLEDYLREKPAEAAPRQELEEKLGDKVVKNALSAGGFSGFNVELRHPPYSVQWIRLKGADAQQAIRIAQEAYKIPDENWEAALALAGDVIRPDAREGKTRRTKVMVRSYTINSAAKRLWIQPETVEEAIKAGVIPTFTDPEGRARLAASEIEAAFDDADFGEKIAGFEVVKARHLALVADMNHSTLYQRLRKADINRNAPLWGEVRGQWGLPATLREFKTVLKALLEEKRAEKAAEFLEIQRRAKEQEEIERRRRDILRSKLVAAFPTWRHEGRNEQQIILHTGAPNSGKTHDALQALMEAGEGWYLAPLRLLAFEVFDELNRQGVFCNLLTGEEYIPVPGAKVTAATIEMFNAKRSGECVVIDEAQMLADPDRGWAWTRALMEAEAPEIHVIGPPTVQTLVEKLSEAAAIPLTVVEHHRLAPIAIAERQWPLHQLPPSTILIAFSRQMVLELKANLEKMKRKVSVIYGSLPPEVRRRQVKRFITGQTDICVATDAVGMGINLPADNVCFFEIEKYDGKQTRLLLPNEVQQIGGRAGRYGLSNSGLVGATNKGDLKMIRQLFYAEPKAPTHARVAPTAEDIALLPGNLSHRLTQWSALQSIPDSLRGVIKTADLTEQITLAGMLSDHEVNQLGMAAALRLVAAPTRQSNHHYWRACATAILEGVPMPLPPAPPVKIEDNYDLETTEMCVTCADVYLWLGRRREFGLCAPDETEVREQRIEWSMQIDEALLRRLDTGRRCARCGDPLSPSHPYRICDRCYRNRFYNGYSANYDEDEGEDDLGGYYQI